MANPKIANYEEFVQSLLGPPYPEVAEKGLMSAFQEALHPRGAKGQPTGGKFVPKSGASMPQPGGAFVPRGGTVHIGGQPLSIDQHQAMLSHMFGNQPPTPQRIAKLREGFQANIAQYESMKNESNPAVRAHAAEQIALHRHMLDYLDHVQHGGALLKR